MNKSESKYFNTAIRMDEALLKLLEKKDFEYITIKEICETAGVNRSTFYLHYENTRELLTESIQYMNRQFINYFPSARKEVIKQIQTVSPHALIFINPEYLTSYLTYIREHKSLFCAAVQKADSMGLIQEYEKMFKHIFDPILERFNIPADERSYRMAFYINGIIAIVIQWLKTDCADSIAHISAIITKCVLNKAV